SKAMPWVVNALQSTGVDGQGQELPPEPPMQTLHSRQLFPGETRPVCSIKVNQLNALSNKIRKAMAERDAGYKLAGLIELDDTYVGGPKPGKRGRGAA